MVRKRHPVCLPRLGRALLGLCMGVAQPLATEAIASPVVGTWQGVPLEQLAESLSPFLGRPLVLDCRVDPTAPVTLRANGAEPAALLDELDRLCAAEAVVLRESVRLAPTGRRDALQAAEETRSAELAATSADLRRRLTQRRANSWPDGATPREVVKALAEAATAEVSGLDLIPHDHLRGCELPTMSRAAQLDLVLAGYDLRAAITPAGLTIVRLDPRSRPTRPPRLDPSAPQPRETMPTEGGTVFTLEAAAPLQELLGAISSQTGLTLRIDTPALEQAGVAPNRVVRVNVEEASLEELLNAITQPLALRWERSGDQLLVTAGSSPPAPEPAAGGPPRD